MSLTDPIADMLSRIRNAIQARQSVLEMPSSKLKKSILERMLEEGYLAAVTVREDNRQGLLVVQLRYDGRGESVIDGLERISKPGRRLYAGVGDIPKARSGYGTVFLSTPKGVMSDRKARELGVGGEVLCSVW
jgi:small subunit ribosomal protein S8